MPTRGIYDPLTEQENKLRFCLPLVLCIIEGCCRPRWARPPVPTMLSNLHRDVREFVCPLKQVRTEQHVSARWINAGDQSVLPCSLRLKNLVRVPFTTLKSYWSIRR